MKRFCYLMAFILISTMTTAQKPSLARVQQINGVEVYILSAPLRKYKVVTQNADYMQPITLLTKGRKDESIEEKVSSLVTLLKRAAAKQHQTIDALLYTNGHSAVGIQFTDSADIANSRLAQVQRINTVATYILSEPLQHYTVEGSKKSLLKFKSLQTHGLINNTIEEDAARFISRLQKHYAIDAVIYNTGKSAFGVRFSGYTLLSETPTPEYHFPGVALAVY